MGLLKFLDELGKVLVYPGAILSGAIDEVSRGAVFDHSTINLDGNCFHAKGDLKDAGIDAFAPVQLGGKMAAIEVKKKDKERALKELRRRGYNCW